MASDVSRGRSVSSTGRIIGTRGLKPEQRDYWKSKRDADQMENLATAIQIMTTLASGGQMLSKAIESGLNPVTSLQKVIPKGDMNVPIDVLTKKPAGKGLLEKVKSVGRDVFGDFRGIKGYEINPELTETIAKGAAKNPVKLNPYAEGLMKKIPSMPGKEAINKSLADRATASSFFNILEKPQQEAIKSTIGGLDELAEWVSTK
tara:strand:- start:6688 stop:7299 length:612 start_codon:yes stop_codon:yes gene_type:complete